MSGTSVSHSTIEINAPIEKVWEALTNPEMIKQYLYGTETKTDRKVGSDITREGVRKETKYEDKGKVLEFEPMKHMKYSYWSSMAGTEDKPENYVNVSSDVEEKDGKTVLTISQDNITEEQVADTERVWNGVLEKIKEITE